MSTTPSFDAELDEIFAAHYPVNQRSPAYSAIKQAIKQLYLTHHNAELEKLLEQAELTTKPITRHSVIVEGNTQMSVSVLVVKNLMESHKEVN